MKLIFSLILQTTIILFSGTVKAQKLKKKINDSGLIKEVFFLDKKTKFKEGNSFIIDKETKDTLVWGQYHNGICCGMWKVNSKRTGHRIMEYDFDSDTLSFLSNEMLTDSFLVVDNGNAKTAAVERPLLFIGWENQLNWEIVTKLKLPEDFLRLGMSGASIINFTFDENGYISSSKILSPLNAEIEQQVNAIINRLSGRFIPARVNGQNVPSSVYLKLNIYQHDGVPAMSLPAKPYVWEINMSYHPIILKKKVITTTSVVSYK